MPTDGVLLRPLARTQLRSEVPPLCPREVLRSAARSLTRSIPHRAHHKSVASSPHLHSLSLFPEGQSDVRRRMN